MHGLCQPLQPQKPSILAGCTPPSPSILQLCPKNRVVITPVSPRSQHLSCGGASSRPAAPAGAGALAAKAAASSLRGATTTPEPTPSPSAAAAADAPSPAAAAAPASAASPAAASAAQRRLTGAPGPAALAATAFRSTDAGAAGPAAAPQAGGGGGGRHQEPQPGGLQAPGRRGGQPAEAAKARVSAAPAPPVRAGNSQASGLKGTPSAGPERFLSTPDYPDPSLVAEYVERARAAREKLALGAKNPPPCLESAPPAVPAASPTDQPAAQPVVVRPTAAAASAADPAPAPDHATSPPALPPRAAAPVSSAEPRPRQTGQSLNCQLPRPHVLGLRIYPLQILVETSAKSCCSSVPANFLSSSA